MSGPVSLDIRQVRTVAHILGIKLSARRLDDLTIMEGAALEVIHKPT